MSPPPPVERHDHLPLHEHHHGGALAARRRRADARPAIADGGDVPLSGHGRDGRLVGEPGETGGRAQHRSAVVGELGLDGIPGAGVQTHARRGEMHRPGDDRHVPHRLQAHAGTPDGQRGLSHLQAGQEAGPGVERSQTRVPHDPPQWRLGNRDAARGQGMRDEFHAGREGHLHVLLERRRDGEGLHGPVDVDVDGLVLQQPRDLKDGVAGPHRAQHAVERDGGHGRHARRPLHLQGRHDAVPLRGHHGVQRVGISRGHENRSGLIDREIRLLHHHRRGRRQPAGRSHLNGPLARRERDDRPVAIDAGDGGRERIPRHAHRRRGRPVILQGPQGHARILGRQQEDLRRDDAESRSGPGSRRLAVERVDSRLLRRGGGRGRLRRGLAGRGSGGRRRDGGRARGHRDGREPGPVARGGLDDGHARAQSRHGAVQVHLGHLRAARSPGDLGRGNHVPDAVEGGGQESGALTDLDADGGRGHLHLGDILAAEGPNGGQGDECGGGVEATEVHGGPNVSPCQKPCQPNRLASAKVAGKLQAAPPLTPSKETDDG